MAFDVDAREQRLRKRAEQQSLSVYLANLRERESSYIQASAAVPEMLVNQINEMRQEIRKLEEELLTLQDESIDKRARQFYWEGFGAELSRDLPRALQSYKSAARYAYPDSSAAIRSVRYKIKAPWVRAMTGAQLWASPAGRSRGPLIVGLLVMLALVMLLAFIGLAWLFPRQGAVAELSSSTPTPPLVVLIVPDTATPLPTVTPLPSLTPVPVSTLTAVPPTAPVRPSSTSTLSPTPVATLRPSPRVIDPKPELVWEDGTIVFEFERLDLDYDELYCVNTLRGYDKRNTENWSYPPVGSKEPRVAIEANVFRVARTQGMKCILWSGSIGKGSCENLISQKTEERMIGLPQPCDFP